MGLQKHKGTLHCVIEGTPIKRTDTFFVTDEVEKWVYEYHKGVSKKMVDMQAEIDELKKEMLYWVESISWVSEEKGERFHAFMDELEGKINRRTK